MRSVQAWRAASSAAPRIAAVSVSSRLLSSQRSRRGSPLRNKAHYGGHYDQRRADPLAQLSFQQTVKIDPAHKTKLADMHFSDATRAVLEHKGFAEMTPVQSQSFQYVLDGKDVVARSRTGTGKTFAFGLPLIEKIVSQGYNQRRQSSAGLPVVLVLEPTRELAVQVAQELGAVCKPHRLRILPVYGGSSFALQEQAFRDGVHIVVATPGRLLDHIREGSIDLSHVEHVVLDEGDTMLEMGFQKDVESILLNVKVPGESSRQAAARALSDDSSPSSSLDAELQNPTKNVQMLLFSATMPAWICQLTDKLMSAPIFLDAVQAGETRLASTITHYALPVTRSGGEKTINAMGGIIEDLIFTKGQGGQTIVFTNTKEDADLLVNSDCFGRLKAQVLHGDISQASRQTTLKQFKDGSIDVLVATDVAARGLDIAGVELVIHTAPPNDADSYVHRSGRTGRAGRSGTSVMLYTPMDAGRLRQFEKALHFQFIPMNTPSVAELAQSSTDYAVKQMQLVEDEVIQHFLPHARVVVEQARTGELFGDEAQNMSVEALLARSMAAISNRISIPSRSLLTGEEGKTTLLVGAEGPYSPNSKTITIWQRFLSNLLAKKFSMDNVRYGKMRVGSDNGKVVLLVDVEKLVAKEITEKLNDVKLPAEVCIGECTALPKLFEDDDEKYARGRDWGERGGGGERRFGSRGGDRGGGDRGSGDRGGRDRDRGDRGSGRGRDDSPWRRKGGY